MENRTDIFVRTSYNGLRWHFGEDQAEHIKADIHGKVQACKIDDGQVSTIAVISELYDIFGHEFAVIWCGNTVTVKKGGHTYADVLIQRQGSHLGKMKPAKA